MIPAHWVSKITTAWVSILMLATLSACAQWPWEPRPSQSNQTPADFRAMVERNEQVDALNAALVELALLTDASEPYTVGVNDQLRIDVIGNTDLSRSYRVNSSGAITMPMLGRVPVAGLTVEELQDRIRQQLALEFIREPEVLVEITEFRSRQYTVFGAVQSPGVFPVSRPTSLIEALAQAGGLAGDAANTIHITDRVIDPSTEQPKVRSATLHLDEITQDLAQLDWILGDQAVINVPRVGVFYVEGAVNSPGAFQQRGETTALTAIAQAGGLTFEAQRANIRVLQRTPQGVWVAQVLDYRQIRDNPSADIAIQSGDIVVVEAQGVRAAWSNFVRVALPLVTLGLWPL